MTKKTLLLTPYYIPLRVIPIEAAIKLKYEELADVVVEYDEEIRSPSVTWKIPAVMRLRKLEKSKNRRLRYSRAAVYARDGYRCGYCGKSFHHKELTRDHVVPRAHGGRTTWTNTISACRRCNSRKGSMSCDEAGMWPLREPVEPKSLVLVNPVAHYDDIPEEWLAFVKNIK